ncbi:MAG: ABC transporter substrate-binding protein [Proteobacteria bacterium]|nr:ABC transporter substrate-binding protein [Pseudomonadota bacterium]
MKKTLFFATLLLVLLGLHIVFSVSHAADTIKVGIVDTYSGPATTYTQDVLDGFTLAINQVNAKGGVLGKKIIFVTRDDKFKPDIALSMAKELVLKERVDLLMGSTNSGGALAISDFAKKEKVPFIVTDAKSDKIVGEKGHRYVFNANENTMMIGKATAIALSKKPYVKYWIMGEDYEFGHACADAIWNNLKALKPNVQLLGQSWRKVGEVDLTPYLSGALQANPDCIISASGGGGVVNFLKSVKTLGLAQKIPIYQHYATDTLALAPLGLEAPEGVMGSSSYHFYYPNIPENKAFTEEFRKTYKKYPGSTALYGYSAGMFIAKAYQKAGKVDTERFIDALEGLVIDSPIGKLEMRACDHQVTLPMYYGVTRKVPGYDFLLGADMVTIPGKDYLPTCEEMMKLRK